VVILFWFGYDCSFDRLYAPYPYHRLQVEAFLRGHLFLSSSIEQVEHGLAWFNGQVSQVWGLGVPIWVLPFELVSRLLSGHSVPDRIPLLASMAVFAWYTATSILSLKRLFGHIIHGISFMFLVLFFPPLWNLILGRQSIFEETILYACLCSTASFLAMVRFLFFRRRVDFWLVCILGALSGLIRVTHAAYGGMAVLVCGYAMLASASRSRDSKKLVVGPLAMTVGRASARAGSSVASPHPNGPTTKKRGFFFRMDANFLIGLSAFFAGLLFLACSNYIRFGSPLECGHRLTNHSSEVVYLTRFANPYARASFVNSAGELWSWVFLSPLHHQGANSDNLLPFQATEVRWREVTQPTFDPSYFAVCVLGCILGANFLWRSARQRGWRFFRQNRRIPCVILGLLAWFLGSTGAIAGFYLYAPILTTRYVLDLAPGFLAPFSIVFFLLGGRWPQLTSLSLLAWLSLQSVGLWFQRDNASIKTGSSRSEITGLFTPAGAKLKSFEGRYSVERHPASTLMHNNGNGWSTTGLAGPIVTLAVDQPQFLDLLVGNRISQSGGPDSYRAKIAGDDLKIESLSTKDVGGEHLTNVRFQIPERIRQQRGEQLVFVAFVNGFETADRSSQRRLFEVRWK
jgi:hypothetical protein